MSGSLDILEDACAKLAYTKRAMFGGHGLFAANGGMFAGIVDDDRIILKFADEAARKELEALGTSAWVYKGKMGSTTMKEWILVPERFYDEPRELAAWAARAYKLVPGKAAKPAKAPKAGKAPAQGAPAKKAAKKAAAKKAAKK